MRCDGIGLAIVAARLRSADMHTMLWMRPKRDGWITTTVTSSTPPTTTHISESPNSGRLDPPVKGGLIDRKQHSDTSTPASLATWYLVALPSTTWPSSPRPTGCWPAWRARACTSSTQLTRTWAVERLAWRGAWSLCNSVNLLEAEPDHGAVAKRSVLSRSSDRASPPYPHPATKPG